jgi:hypothetical protein
MSKPKILIQLDPDSHASAFDSVVAIDSGVDHLLRYSNVEPADVPALVHGAIFTRSVQDLASTAIFIGGSDVAAGEELLSQAKAAFFGPLRVSILVDPSGANTTAAAAVLTVTKHLDLRGASAVVLGGTGPVGQRAARLLASEGASVRVASRSLDRAAAVCRQLAERIPAAKVTPLKAAAAPEIAAALDGAAVVIAAGAAGVELLPVEIRRNCAELRVAIDLNAVPPLGIAGIEAVDKAKDRDGVRCYGALGVGGTKMKIHRAAIQKLFAANDLVLDTEEVFQIGKTL